jgi:hypothetical protein
MSDPFISLPALPSLPGAFALQAQAGVSVSEAHGRVADELDIPPAEDPHSRESLSQS